MNERYGIAYDRTFEKDVKKLKAHGQKVIRAFEAKLHRLQQSPKLHGKMLVESLKGLWSARFSGDFRLIYDVNETTRVLTLIRVGHRREIYDMTQRGRS